jgi:puromycin-sensitive aminopeptidase
MSTDKDKKAEGRVLLPSTIVPTRYDLKLTPDLEAFTFKGEISIELETSADLDGDCNEIVMHAKELCFISASYRVSGNESPAVEAQEINDNKKATTVTFVFPNSIPASSTIIMRISYMGFLNNQMCGFYRSSYQNIHGEKKIMASTQFESLDARRAFPCWDEPARKAVFGVTLVVPVELTAFSNMPEKCSKTLEGGKLRETIYLDSPKMSTYLVAFCVGEFDYVQAQTEHGVLVKVYTPPGKSESGQFALDCATKALDCYDDFFGIGYPLPKLDMVAIPEFAMGAMENWGLVTYREVDLLIDPTKASSSQKQRVCTVVTHELAHQWFGNLVTMAWWDDLWLNEGFASWAENWAADKIFPDWTMWDQFTTGHLSYAMKLDSLKSSHPIQVPIRHAEEVEEVFDGISYCKGGSVVRMIRAVLGMKAFQTGLGNYMKKFAYGNTETVDLWGAWEESSGMPVKEMMATWTEQMGFPLVKVIGETWESDKVILELEQSWFLSDGSSVEGDDKKWCIPILTCTDAGTQKDMIFMREKTAKVEIPLSSEKGWVKLNAGQEVPMRVLPSSTMVERLSEAIKNKSLPVCDRAALVTDGYALVKSGHMKPEELIKLLASYTNEDAYIVWQGLADVLSGLDTVTQDDEDMNCNFRKFARELVIALQDRVGWEKQAEDGHLTVLLRSIMTGLLSKFCHTDESVANEAKTRFATFQEDPSDMQNLPSDMRSSVFKIILKNGGKKEWDEVKSYFFASTDQAERKFVLGTLGATNDAKMKLQTLEWSISGEVKLQDFFYLMGSVGHSSRVGAEISWKFFRDNFVTIKDMIGKGSPSLMDACIINCAGGFCSGEKADEIDAFFKANPLPSSARKIAQCVEGMRTNAKFLEKLQDSDLSSTGFWASI